MASLVSEGAHSDGSLMLALLVPLLKAQLSVGAGSHPRQDSGNWYTTEETCVICLELNRSLGR